MKNHIKTVEPKNMPNIRMEIDEFIELRKDQKAEILDIRAKFETDVWGLGFGLKIPANELPDRLSEIPKDKIIVVACPKMDRSILGYSYLATEGYDVRYLGGGLLNLMDKLKGGKAKSIIL